MERKKATSQEDLHAASQNLPPDWSVVWVSCLRDTKGTTEDGYNYYFNNLTYESFWEIPAWAWEQQATNEVEKFLEESDSLVSTIEQKLAISGEEFKDTTNSMGLSAIKVGPRLADRLQEILNTEQSFVKDLQGLHDVL